MLRSLSKIFMTVAVVSIAIATPVHAQENRNLCGKILKGVLVFFMDTSPIYEFHAKLADGAPLRINIARRIDNGMGGEVFELAENPGLALPTLPEGSRWVVKLPIRIKSELGGGSFIHSRLVLKRDVELETLLYKNLWKIELSREFPGLPYWKSGRLPALPILHSLETNRGTVIFKPYLEGGESIHDLLKKYPDVLPDKVVSQLRQIYQLAQAMHDQIRGPGIGALDFTSTGTHFISLDINPRNLVWISDPKQIEFYGLNEPGFIRA